MQPISRRSFLALSASVVAAACSNESGSDTRASTTTAAPDTTSTTPAPSTTLAVPPADLPGDPFRLGVASGDPDAGSVVLWTRLAPDPLGGGGMPDADFEVLWEASRSDAFATVAASGLATAEAAHGHCVHAVATLDPGEWFYRFRIGEFTSPAGRTMPAPSAGQPLQEARFAVGSCQNYANGFYAAHRDIAEQRPDFMVWLGDYIYEGAGDEDAALDARVHLGPEPTTVQQYRDRYARYKTDPHLQAAHAACPWFVIWDDHEVENNYADLTPQDPAEAPTFRARRFAAYQAWWEHQPTRLAAPTEENAEYRIYRDAQWGDLIELALLDGRQYRSDQACDDAVLSLAPACPETTAIDRTMLGAEQEQWLHDTLDASTAVWNVIGNQVILADATFNGAVLNYDQWDGYQFARSELLRGFADREIPNVVVLTGDIHLAAVAQLRWGDRGAGTPVGVEFVTTSISSDGLVGVELTELLQQFPDLLDVELGHRGYALHTVTPNEWTAEYRIVTDVASPDSEVTTYGTYVVQAGTNTVEQA